MMAPKHIEYEVNVYGMRTSGTLSFTAKTRDKQGEEGEMSFDIVLQDTSCSFDGDKLIIKRDIWEYDND